MHKVVYTESDNYNLNERELIESYNFDLKHETIHDVHKKV